MTIESACESSWVTLNYDSDYEINTDYPYQIRKKSKLKILKETQTDIGYLVLTLNKKLVYKHRIVAHQFIPNDDPETKIQIDHIDRNRLNNRINNLRWVTAKENNQNKSEYRTQPSEYLYELPETADPILEYNIFKFNRYYFDTSNNNILMITVGNRIKVVKPYKNGNATLISLTDVNKKQRQFRYDTFMRYLNDNF